MRLPNSLVASNKIILMK